MRDEEKRLRDALAAGPTIGKLSVYHDHGWLVIGDEREDVYLPVSKGTGVAKAPMAQVISTAVNAAPALLAERDKLAAECERLRAEQIKSERRAIEFGDIVHKHVVVMRAAVVAGELESPADGLQWIANTLFGPGNLPDLDEARALGGAQELFDKEMAELEAFRAAHPAPTLAARQEPAHG